jgi:DNA-binding protein HU-beta
VNKSEFVQLFAERTDLSKAAATRSLDGILETLTEVMVDRDEVSFAGWGKFSAQRRKGREAHDPRDAQRTIHVPAAYVPKFKAGSVLRREIAA